MPHPDPEPEPASQGAASRANPAGGARCLAHRTPTGSERPWGAAHWLAIGCLLLLALPALQPLASTRLTCGYDNAFHLWRALEAGVSLRQGVLYPRWAPDMAHGYGYPLFSFQSPLSAQLAALLNLLGVAWPLALNAVFALGMLAGALGMFGLGQHLGGALAGLVAGVAYLYAPFQAYDVFNRGSLSEGLAWAFPPLVVWALHRWALEARRGWLVLAALALAGLILSHQLFAVLFVPLWVGWVLVEASLARDWRVVARGALVGILGLGLTAFFWLPGLAERGWVQTERLLGTWVFDFRHNFLDLGQLFALPRVPDPALLNDWPPKALGLLPALAALVPLVRWRGLAWALRRRSLLLAACGGGFALLTLPVTRPLWERLPLLEYVQFPWRFLGPAAFCAALLAGLGLAGLRPGPAGLGASVVIPVLVIGNLGWLYPEHCTPPKDVTLAGMIAWERASDTLGTTAKGEYLPIWVQEFPREETLATDYMAGGPVVRLRQEALPTGVRILRARYGATRATIELESPIAFRARYLAFYYPGWQVRVDGTPVAVAPSVPEGLLEFDVPAGRHTLTVRWGSTPLRSLAWALSALSAVALAAGVCLPLLRRRSRPPRGPRANGGKAGMALPALMVLVTVGYCLALGLNLTPYLRGPREWRWVYAPPVPAGRLWLPALALGLYVGLAWLWVRLAAGQAHHGRRLRRALLLASLVVSVPLLQASLLAGIYGDPLKPLFYRTVSPGASGVFSVGSTIEDARAFLADYPALMPTFPVHPQRYPPGLPLLFYAARRVLERLPPLADGIGFHLRLFQCHDLVLMRLSNATMATAVVQMALPAVAGLALVPLYALARAACGTRTAAYAAALYPLVPSFALWSARWEQFYAVLAALAWASFFVGLTQRRRGWLLVAGLVVALGSFLNFSLLALLLPMGLFVLLGWLREAERRRLWGPLLGDGLVFLAALVGPWAVYQAALGTGFADIWRVSMSYHLGLARGYWLWLGYHLYDFLVFLGLPLALAFVGAAWMIAKHWLRRAEACASGGDLRSGGAALISAVVAGLLLLDLAGVARGEVARVWLFLTPTAALVAAWALARSRWGQRETGFVLVAALLALQLFTANAFLRVVTTGLIDPPARKVSFEPPRAYEPVGARFAEPGTGGESAIVLLGYTLEPASPAAGDPLVLTLYWQPQAPLRRAYTVATHLVGPDGAIAAQHDGMPVDGTLPTTCWLPHEIVADRRQLALKADTTPGRYTLQVGWYLLESAERLAAAGPGATPERMVVLRRLEIGGE